MILRFFVFLMVMLTTLVWRFPYDKAIAERVARLENSTQCQLTYTPVSASIRGVEWSDVRLTARGGVQAAFEQAKLRPTLQGLSSYFRQSNKGQARLNLNQQGQIQVRMDRLTVNSGSPEFGTLLATGDLSHDLGRKLGEGNLRLELPEFKAPLPVADLQIEVGSKLFWQDKGQGYELRAEVNLVGGPQFHAEGVLGLTPQPNGPHSLSGSLQFRTPLRRGSLRLFGTWKQPQWTVVPQP